MSEEKKIKITYAPGAFDNWEGTQEELDEFLEELRRQIESGEFFENSVSFEDIDELEIDEIDIENPSKRNLH